MAARVPTIFDGSETFPWQYQPLQAFVTRDNRMHQPRGIRQIASTQFPQISDYFFGKCAAKQRFRIGKESASILTRIGATDRSGKMIGQLAIAPSTCQTFDLPVGDRHRYYAT